MNPLRFAFAKRYGVLVTDVDSSMAKVLYIQKPTLAVLAEIRRHIQRPFILEQANEIEFNHHLIKTYETDTSVAMQMAEDLGESMSLSDLMQEMPKAEDLLEK